MARRTLVRRGSELRSVHPEEDDSGCARISASEQDETYQRAKLTNAGGGRYATSMSITA